MAIRNGIPGYELYFPGRMLLGLVPRTGRGSGEIKAGSVALSWEFALGSLEIFASSSTSFFQRERARKTVRPKGGLKEK